MLVASHCRPIKLLQKNLDRLNASKVTYDKILVCMQAGSVGPRLSLKKNSTNTACVFLTDGKCSVYQHRPTQVSANKSKAMSCMEANPCNAVLSEVHSSCKSLSNRLRHLELNVVQCFACTLPLCASYSVAHTHSGQNLSLPAMIGKLKLYDVRAFRSNRLCQSVSTGSTATWLRKLLSQVPRAATLHAAFQICVCMHVSGTCMVVHTVLHLPRTCSDRLWHMASCLNCNNNLNR